MRSIYYYYCCIFLSFFPFLYLSIYLSINLFIRTFVIVHTHIYNICTYMYVVVCVFTASPLGFRKVVRTIWFVCDSSRALFVRFTVETDARESWSSYVSFFRFPLFLYLPSAFSSSSSSSSISFIDIYFSLFSLFLMVRQSFCFYSIDRINGQLFRHDASIHAHKHILLWLGSRLE